MGPYGQTILQLQGQLSQSGHPARDQEYVGSAYRLAAELFSGQYRGSGKTFLAHLVGTASILIFSDAPMPVVAAGLLHAAYDQGDFGLGFLGRHGDKQAEIIRAVGSEAEEHIQRYFRLRWTAETIVSLHARAPSLSANERLTVLIRLANELEDHLDLGIQFCANRAQRMERMIALADHFSGLARQLGHPQLAEELTRVFSENQSAAMPAAVQGRNGYSTVHIPRSCRRRYVSVLRSFVSRQLNH